MLLISSIRVCRKPYSHNHHIVNVLTQSYDAEFRRHIRPFFLSADGKMPTKYKIYYDICGYLATQLSFSFAAAPFIILDLKDSLIVWARVYFYCIIGVAVSITFFASPATLWLSKKLARRNAPTLKRLDSQEHLPALGLPNDPEKELDEVIAEMKEGIE